MQGAIVALSNPKTLLFFGAFFPQFIDPARDQGLQISIMGVTAMLFAAISDSAYAIASGRAGRALSARRVTAAVARQRRLPDRRRGVAGPLAPLGTHAAAGADAGDFSRHSKVRRSCQAGANPGSRAAFRSKVIVTVQPALTPRAPMRTSEKEPRPSWTAVNARKTSAAFSSDDDGLLQQPFDDFGNVRRASPVMALKDPNGLHQRDQADEARFVFGQAMFDELDSLR